MKQKKFIHLAQSNTSEWYDDDDDNRYYDKSDKFGDISEYQDPYSLEQLNKELGKIPQYKYPPEIMRSIRLAREIRIEMLTYMDDVYNEFLRVSYTKLPDISATYDVSDRDQDEAVLENAQHVLIGLAFSLSTVANKPIKISEFAHAVELLPISEEVAKMIDQAEQILNVFLNQSRSKYLQTIIQSAINNIHKLSEEFAMWISKEKKEYESDVQSYLNSLSRGWEIILTKHGT